MLRDSQQSWRLVLAVVAFATIVVAMMVSCSKCMMVEVVW